MTCSQNIQPANWSALTSPLGFQVANPACHSAFPLPSLRVFSLNVLSKLYMTTTKLHQHPLYCQVSLKYWCLSFSAIMSTAHVLVYEYCILSPNFSNHITRIVMYTFNIDLFKFKSVIILSPNTALSCWYRLRINYCSLICLFSSAFSP